MKLIIVFLSLVLPAFSAYSQAIIEHDKLIIGYDSIPGLINREGALFYFDSDNGALRGGNLENPFNNPYYQRDSVGVSSFAFGRNVVATGENSVALGNNAQAKSNESIALGSGIATGQGAVSIGGGESNNLQTVNLGNSVSSGAYSFSAQFGESSGFISSSFGEGKSRGNYSTTFGRGTINNSFAGNVLGVYNDTLIHVIDSITDDTPLLIVGNGDVFIPDFTTVSALDESEGKSQSKFNEFGIIELRNNAFEVYYDGKSVFKPKNAISNIEIDKDRLDEERGLEPIIVPDSMETGYVGTPDFPFYKMYAKEFYADSDPANYMTYSDRRLKKNILPITSAISLIGQLNPVTYQNIDDQQSKNVYGLIAQELEEVIPELVTEDPNGIKAVGYQALIPILIKSLQEQQEIIDTQSEQIDSIIQLINTEK